MIFSYIILTVIGFYDVHLSIFISKGKPGFDYTIRTEFKKNALALERTDVLMIEHLMRNGKRKLEYQVPLKPFINIYSSFVVLLKQNAGSKQPALSFFAGHKTWKSGQVIGQP